MFLRVSSIFLQYQVCITNLKFLNSSSSTRKILTDLYLGHTLCSITAYISAIYIARYNCLLISFAYLQ